MYALNWQIVQINSNNCKNTPNMDMNEFERNSSTQRDDHCNGAPSSVSSDRITTVSTIVLQSHPIQIVVGLSQVRTINRRIQGNKLIYLVCFVLCRRLLALFSLFIYGSIACLNNFYGYNL